MKNSGLMLRLVHGGDASGGLSVAKNLKGVADRDSPTLCLEVGGDLTEIADVAGRNEIGFGGGDILQTESTG